MAAVTAVCCPASQLSDIKVLHFTGHGSLQSSLMLENDDGSVMYYPREDLWNLLSRGVGRNVRSVALAWLLFAGPVFLCTPCRSLPFDISIPTLYTHSREFARAWSRFPRTYTSFSSMCFVRQAAHRFALYRPPPQLRLLFLSSCHSENIIARTPEGAESGIPHVIAVRRAVQVQVRVAELFAKYFYQLLFSGKSVRAVRWGRHCCGC